MNGIMENWGIKGTIYNTRVFLFQQSQERPTIRHTHKIKIMFIDSKITVTIETKVWDNKGKATITTSLSISSILNDF